MAEQRVSVLLVAEGGRQVASVLFPGPVSIFDLGNSVLVDLAYGTLASVTDLDVLGGANVFAVESAPGTWEILQAATAELVAPGRYKLVLS